MFASVCMCLFTFQFILAQAQPGRSRASRGRRKIRSCEYVCSLFVWGVCRLNTLYKLLNALPTIQFSTIYNIKTYREKIRRSLFNTSILSFKNITRLYSHSLCLTCAPVLGFSFSSLIVKITLVSSFIYKEKHGKGNI